MLLTYCVHIVQKLVEVLKFIHHGVIKRHENLTLKQAEGAIFNLLSLIFNYLLSSVFYLTL